MTTTRDLPNDHYVLAHLDDITSAAVPHDDPLAALARRWLNGKRHPGDEETIRAWLAAHPAFKITRRNPVRPRMPLTGHPGGQLSLWGENHEAVNPRKRRRQGPTHCRDCGVRLTTKNAYKRSDAGTFRNPCRRCWAKVRRARHDRAEDQRRQELGQTHLTCDVCGAEETVTRSGRIRRPTVDHDHKTGRIRGVLCSRCNSGIGLFRDNPTLLRAAAEYLAKTSNDASGQAA